MREALLEHGLVEFSLLQADRETRAGDMFDARVKLLEEVIAHHVEEEEREILPKAERALSTQLDALGTKMKLRFDAMLNADYRRPLARNVRQVIRGAVKTEPAQRPTTRAKSTATARGRSRKTRKTAARTHSNSRARARS